MKKIERVFVVLILLGMIMKLFHIPFSGPILVLSITSMAMAYALGSYFLFGRHLKTAKVLVVIGSGMVMGIGLLGLLYKLMFWPGSNIMLLVSFTMLLIFVGLGYVIFQEEDKQKSFTQDSSEVLGKTMLIRVSIVLFFVSSGLVISSKSLYAFIHRDDPKLVELWVRSEENPGNEEYRKDLIEYQQSKFR